MSINNQQSCNLLIVNKIAKSGFKGNYKPAKPTKILFPHLNSLFSMADGRSEKLLLVFLVFLLLFNYPLLSIFDRPEMWSGVPVLYLYMFLVWGAMIISIWLIVRQTKK